MSIGRSTIRDTRVELISAAPLDLERLVTEWPFKSHRWRSDAPARVLDRLAVDRLNKILASPDVRAWVVKCGDVVQAVAVLQQLEWDSRILEMSAGKLEIVLSASAREPCAVADTLAATALEEARRVRLRHLSARVDASDTAVIHALEGHGFRNVDVLLTFGAPVDDLPRHVPLPDLELRRGSPADTAAVAEIAATCFRDGRFHADPAISVERAQNVYRSWARACCEGTAADQVIVAMIDDRVVGFTACAIQRDTIPSLPGATGTITLIASSDRARGRGVGSALIGAASEWFRSREVRAVEVGTHVGNTRAARLYERCGFRLVGGALSFRTVIES